MSSKNSPTTITHEDEASRGAFFVERNGERMAELTYRIRDGVADLDHTEVDDSLRGDGVGARLVEAAVQWARGRRIKLLPTCSYAKSVFDKTPDYADVRAPQQAELT